MTQQGIPFMHPVQKKSQGHMNGGMLLYELLAVFVSQWWTFYFGWPRFFWSQMRTYVCSVLIAVHFRFLYICYRKNY